MECAAILALMVSGAVLEALAFVLVALDARATGRRLRDKVQKRPQLVQVGSIAHQRALGTPTVTGGHTETETAEPTAESRLLELEQRVSAAEAKAQQAAARADERHEWAQNEIARQVAEARREAFERPLDVREELANEIAVSLPRRVALFVAGLALATAGNVWSVLT